MNEMTAITQLAVTRLILNDARYEALSASGLQPPGAPTADMVIAAISCTVQQFESTVAPAGWPKISAPIPP